MGGVIKDLAESGHTDDKRVKKHFALGKLLKELNGTKEYL